MSEQLFAITEDAAECLHIASELRADAGPTSALAWILVASAEDNELGEMLDRSSVETGLQMASYTVPSRLFQGSSEVVEVGEDDLRGELVPIIRGAAHAARLREVTIGRRELLAALLDQDSHVGEVLSKAGATRARLLDLDTSNGGSDIDRTALLQGVQRMGEAAEPGPTGSDTWAPVELPSHLARFGHDLTELAFGDRLDPMIGRAEELARALVVLSRRTKNNVVLLGDPGVGKTAIVEGLAQRIIAGRVPPQLRDRRIVALDMAALVGGAKFRGDFEDRLKGIVVELRDSRGQIVLFVDEIHTIVGAGASEGTLDAANLLKPILSRGDVRTIGATTMEEYRRHIEGDGALARRFQPILVLEPSQQESERILQAIAHHYEDFHGVRYARDALTAATKLSGRYIVDRFLPDKAIDLLDEAGARHSLDGGHDRLVGREDVATVVSDWARVPVASLLESEAEKLAMMEARMRERVIGQDHAVRLVSDAIRSGRTGLADPGRPIGSFMFYGGPGVGKTLLAKALAEFLFDSDRALVRIDMSEYAGDSAVNRLIGAPPGYVGYEESGVLTEAVRRRPYSVVLLDEIDKAGADLVNLFLQVLSAGRLTDGRGRFADFTNSVIIMTLNAASRDEVLDRFANEFLDRFDEIVEFEKLDSEAMERIVEVELEPLIGRAKSQQIDLRLSAAGRAELARQGLADGTGARPLGRLIRRLVTVPLSREIASAERNPARRVVVIDADANGTLVLETNSRRADAARSRR